MALSDDGRATLAALSFIQSQLANLPLAIAQNAAGATQTAASGPPKSPAESPDRTGRRGAVAVDMLLGSLVRLLGPLAALHTFLGASTSGFSIFTSAMRVFATAVAPILLPAFFLLSTALIAGSEVIFQKLLPSLGQFFSFVLQSGIPAVVAFAETVGRATAALKWLADSKLGGAAVNVATGAVGGGGPLGALSRTFDRLTGEGWGGDGSVLGGMKAGHRALDDLFRLAPGGLGESIVGHKTALLKAVGGADADPYSGVGVDRDAGGTGAGGAAAATGRAMKDTLRELLLSMGPKAQQGSVSSVWSRAQMSVLSQSPFERRMLEMMSEVVKRMSMAASEPGGGRLTEPTAIRAMVPRDALAAPGGLRWG